MMKTDLYIKKPIPLIRIGEHAGVVFSEYAITICSYKAIDQIAKWARYDAGD